MISCRALAALAFMSGLLPVAAETAVPQDFRDAPAPLYSGGLRYPDGARIRDLAGVVPLIVTIAPEGRVTDLSVEAEDPPGYGFAIEARKAVRKWVYPGGRAGTYRQRVVFSLYDPQHNPDGVEKSVSGIPEAPAPLERVDPVYPEKALAAGVSGQVDIVVQLRADGTVARADVAQETPKDYEFGRAAVRAVDDWRFPPGTSTDPLIVRVTFKP